MQQWFEETLDFKCPVSGMLIWSTGVKTHPRFPINGPRRVDGAFNVLGKLAFRMTTLTAVCYGDAA